MGAPGRTYRERYLPLDAAIDEEVGLVLLAALEVSEATYHR